MQRVVQMQGVSVNFRHQACEEGMQLMCLEHAAVYATIPVPVHNYTLQNATTICMCAANLSTQPAFSVVMHAPCQVASTRLLHA